MGMTLGLDIGSNSVGWALVDESTESLIAAGVRVFPEGVKRGQKLEEQPKNAERRLKRGLRRRLARVARRKRAVRKALVEAGFCGSEADLLTGPDPIELRAKGLDEQLSLTEFARVLLHFSTRRGFLSNRKVDRSDDKDASKLLEAMAELQLAIEAKGCRTLGEFLHRERCEAAEPGRYTMRRRPTRRQMYLHEFELLWNKQAEFHPILRDETLALKYGTTGRQEYPVKPQQLRRSEHGKSLLRQFGFHGLLFFQRQLYWPKSSIGRCELERGQRRCERADRVAQRFRLLNEVGNLRVLPPRGQTRALTAEERTRLLKELSKRKDATFDDVRKWLSLPENTTFNLEAGGRGKLDGMPVDKLLDKKKLFGKRWWEFGEQVKDAIVRALIDCTEEEIQRQAVEDWGCTEEEAAKLSQFNPATFIRGQASLSRVAMARLLPHLEAGKPLMTRDDTESALAAAGYLRPDQRTRGAIRQLPPPPPQITNPLVRKAMFEVRKVVNAIIREWGMPQAIHVELAREVQGNAEQRAERSKQMRDREKERDRLKADAIERGYTPTHDTVERFALWREQGEHCLYSGNPISKSQIGLCEVDHILPYSQTLDDGLTNKVLVFREENQQKGQRTLWEWLGESDPVKYERILHWAEKLRSPTKHVKLRKLQTRTVSLDDFLNRQLSDTGYITTQVTSELKRLEGVDVVTVKGQVTAELRHAWRLNRVLRLDDINAKSRDDHRHHAIDALVIALTTRSRLAQLARLRFSGDSVALPWSGLRDQATETINAIWVSHRASRRVSGALHEDTIYGSGAPAPHTPRRNTRPRATNAAVVHRSLVELKPKEVARIIDDRIRTLVFARLNEHKVIVEKVKEIPPSVWAEPLLLTPIRPKSSSRPAVIRRVRISVTDATIQHIGNRNGMVKPGNTHHISFFESMNTKTGKSRRVVVFVSMLEAAARVLTRRAVVSREHPDDPNARFLFSICRGDTIHGEIRGTKTIWVYRTSPSTRDELRLTAHNDSTGKLTSAAANTLDGYKVVIDPIGRMRQARD